MKGLIGCVLSKWVKRSVAFLVNRSGSGGYITSAINANLAL